MSAVTLRWNLLRTAFGAGIPIGTGLGILAVLLFVALEPNLRLLPALSLLRLAPRFLAAYILAGVVTASLVLTIPQSMAWYRHARRALGALLPLTGFFFAVLFFAIPVRLYVPGVRGLVLTSTELFFPVAVVLLTLALVPWLGKWGASGVHQGASGLLAAASLVLLLALAASFRVVNPAASLEPQPDTQVVLIGIDGADWRTIRALVQQGGLPNLADLIDNGATGELQTMRPTLSPIVWTTIATGHPPAHHGIKGFIMPESGIPVTSNMRRTPAVWNLLGDAGVSVGIVGWWVTWPAEQVKGHLVSSYSTAEQMIWKGTLYEDLEDQTHPPELLDEIQPLIKPAVDAGMADFKALLAALPRPPEDEDFVRREYYGSWVFSSDRVFTETAVYLAERYAPRFLATYLAAPDVVAHKFCEQNPFHQQSCRQLLDGAYVTLDRLIGRILAAAEPDATVMIVSDHGFDPLRGHEHAPPGIVLMQGRGVRAGGRIRAASVYDVLPTILSLFSVPVAENLRGRALLTAFEPTFQGSERIAFVPGQAVAEAQEPLPAPTDEAVKERLRSLGYIQ